MNKFLEMFRRFGSSREVAGPATDAVPVVRYPSTDWIERSSISTILDIGANSGDFAVTMARRFPAARVISFEPLTDAAAELRRRTQGIPHCTAIDCALGDMDGEIDMQRCVYSPSSSILPMADLHRRAVPFTDGDSKTERIRIRRLDDVAQEVPMPDGIFAKIDVQGFEDRVIRGGVETLRRARVIIVETSFATLYEGQPLFREIFAALNSLGFDYAGNWDQLADPASGRILQADAIFLRQA